MQINIQPIEKLVYRDHGELEVHSIFHTIQGEGPFAGHSAVFVRLAGCNLQCPGCDTEYTKRRGLMSVEDIAIGIAAAVPNWGKTSLVVITGGEPLRQNLAPLVNHLIVNGFKVQVETNGVLPLGGLMQIEETSSYGEVHYMTPARTVRKAHTQPGLYIVVSPKTHKINAEVAKAACAFKYVVDLRQGINERDGLPRHALDNQVGAGWLARPPVNWHGPIYIQPRDEQDPKRNGENLKFAVRIAQDYGHILQLQIHKIIGVE